MYILACDKPITAGVVCPSGWVVVEYTKPLGVEALSPEVALQYFGAGFALPVVPLAAALGVAILIKFMRG